VSYFLTGGSHRASRGLSNGVNGESLPAPPAIANAIYDAVGVRMKDLPITPEKVLAALKEKANPK
jgi:hypothetical protein